MTEKRFNLVGSYLYDGDECISHFDDPKHRDEIVELLNDFYNENEQLKESNERFSKTVAEQIIMIKEYGEENEQLKSKNRGLQSELQIFKEDVTHSNQIINKLNDENEQFKSEINMLKNTIGRNEAFIKRITTNGEWNNTSMKQGDGG